MIIIVKNRMMRIMFVTAMSLILVMGMTVSVFGYDTDGSGGDAFKGPSVNTFARSMDLQTIYLNKVNFQEASDLNGTDLRKNTGQGHVYVNGNSLKATGTKDYTGYSWKYVYKDAAVYPDGSTADLTVYCVLDKIYTASLDSSDNSGSLVPESSSSTFGGSGATVRLFGGNTHNEPTGDVFGSGDCRSMKAFVRTTVSVGSSSTYTTGTYIIPITGVNAYKGSGGAWKPLVAFAATLASSDPQSDNTRIRREEMTYTGKKYIPANNGFDFFDGETTVAGNEENKSGVDDSYQYGMAIEGTSSGTEIKFGETGGYIGSNQGNSMKFKFGDLQHRIWSGSGPNGSIATGKRGTGTDFEGGKFTGEISSITGNESTLRRYVIPDDKTDVTYTMTPEKGYVMDKISVDGTEFTVPDDPATGKTWTTEIPSTDGGGVLKHEGNGKFTYTFGNANTKDHTIYVTWKKGKEDPTTTTTTRPTQTTTASDTTKESDDNDSKHGKSTSTGDRFMPFMIGGIMLLAAAVIIVTLIHRRRQDS